MSEIRFLVVGDSDSDLFVKVDHIPTWDEGLLASGYELLPGGKAANSATQLASLGADVYLYSIIGRDSYANIAIKNFEKSGLHSDFVYQNAESTTLCIMMLDHTGEKAIVVLPSEDIYPREKYRNIIEGHGEQFSHLHLIGMNPEKTDWIILWAKENGLKVSVDIDSANGGYDRFRIALENADLIFMNKQGLRNLVMSDWPNDTLQAIRNIRKKTRGDIVCTLGSEGACFCGSSEVKFEPAKKIQPVDTTGCGDAFASAFLYSYIVEKNDVITALKFSNNAAALIAGVTGGQGVLLGENIISKE